MFNRLTSLSIRPTETNYIETVKSIRGMISTVIITHQFLLSSKS